MCITTELDMVTKTPAYKRQWLELVGWIRDAAPHVKLVNGQNTRGLANFTTPTPHTTFQSALDFIGCSAYYPFSAADLASRSAVAARWSTIGVELAAAADYWQQPVLLTECGSIGSFTTPGPDALAADFIGGLCDALGPHDWFAGALYWRWPQSTSAPATPLATDTWRALT